jgi:hypothetical protein
LRLVIDRSCGGGGGGSAPRRRQSRPQPPSQHPSTRRILMVSTWRSGSSFLGQLIASWPGVFYSFETTSAVHQRDQSRETQTSARPCATNLQCWPSSALLFPSILIKVVELAFTTNSSSALAGHPVTDRWKIVDLLVRDPSRLPWPPGPNSSGAWPIGIAKNRSCSSCISHSGEIRRRISLRPFEHGPHHLWIAIG